MQKFTFRTPDGITLLAMIGALALTILAYTPGISGNFYLDDFPNLDDLDRYIASPTFSTAWAFITGNHSGPLGRPLSMATFLLEAFDWPHDATAFRATNLALHLCNGLMLFLVLTRISRIQSHRQSSAPFWISAFWLVSPANTATTLYVVQRMTILSTFLMLVGLAFYLAGRHRHAENIQRGHLQIFLGLFIGTVLGSLAKENAATFPLIILAFEFTLFSTAQHSIFIRILRAALPIPHLALLASQLIPWQKYVASFALQPFSWQERLITQPLAIVSYARNTLTPAAANIGIYNDQFPPVRDLFSEPLAFAAIVVVLATFFTAIRFRRSHPIPSLCVLTFFACHALESSIFSLELYFEHRNYLASSSIIAFAYIALNAGKTSFHRLAKIGFGFLALAFSAYITQSIAVSWGDPTLAAMIWPQQFPDSVRVREMSADTWARQGQFIQAENELKEGIQRHPEQLILRVQALQMRCERGADVHQQFGELALVAKQGKIVRGVFDSLSYLYAMASSERCPGLTAAKVREVTHALLDNPETRNSSFLSASGWFIVAEASADLGDLDSAFDALDNAKSHRNETKGDFWRIVWSINNNHDELAVARLAEMRTQLGSSSPTPELAGELTAAEAIVRAHKENPSGATLFVNPVRLEHGLPGIDVRPVARPSKRIIIELDDERVN